MEIKEKRKVKLNYNNSGVKTLNKLAVFFNVLAYINLFAGVICLVIALVDDDSFTLGVVIYLLIGFLSCLFIGTISQAISSISLTALCKRSLMEEEVDFE